MDDKAKKRQELDDLIRRAHEVYDAMTEDEKQQMHNFQRESWARGQAALIEFDREMGYC